MHELSVTQSILDIAIKHAERAGAGRIRAINVVVGELTGFMPDSIQFYFDFLSRDTLAAGATLHIDRVGARVRCRECGAEFHPPNTRLWSCPECSALGGDIVAGREFSVASLEVE